MNYRSHSRPQVQRVNVKVNPSPKPPVRRNVTPMRPVVQPRIRQVAKQAVKPTVVAAKTPPSVSRLPQPPQAQPQHRPQQNVRQVRNRLDTKRVNPILAQHDSLLQQYKDSISRLRCVGNNKILVIVACGPSILEVPIDKLVGHDKIDLMCINKPDKRVWPTPYWLFCDQSQYTRNQNLWTDYGGLVINASSVRARHKRQVLIKNMSGKGFSRDMGKGFYIGRSSTYAAMQVALWMNYRKIYIIGVDMCAVDGKVHYYGQNPDVPNDHRIQRFDREAESYLYAATEVLRPEDTTRFTFCSSYNKYSFTNYFPSLHQKDAVDTILREANI